MILLMKPCCAWIALASLFMAALPFIVFQRLALFGTLVLLLTLLSSWAEHHQHFAAAFYKVQEVRPLPQGTYNPKSCKDREMEAEVNKQQLCMVPYHWNSYATIVMNLILTQMGNIWKCWRISDISKYLFQAENLEEEKDQNHTWGLLHFTHPGLYEVADAGLLNLDPAIAPGFRVDT